MVKRIKKYISEIVKDRIRIDSREVRDIISEHLDVTQREVSQMMRIYGFEKLRDYKFIRR